MELMLLRQTGTVQTHGQMGLYFLFYMRALEYGYIQKAVSKQIAES